MPTSTFFNLPPEKRAKLLRAAVGEFSQKPYGEVPLSRIIAGAGIPRGSFYQYFSDKTDLFVYVLSHYGGRLKQLVLRCLEDCGGDLLALPAALFDAMMAAFAGAGEEIRGVMAILRHNAGFDAGRMCQPPGLAEALLAAARTDTLALKDPEDRQALAELLLTATGQAVAAAACGQDPALCRERLERKVALLRRGAAKQEDITPCCK